MKVYQKPETEAEKEQELKILALNGIPKRSTRRKTLRKYRLYIYKFEVIALFQNEKGGEPWVREQTRKKEYWSPISTNRLTKEIIKVKNLAIRSLYLLGYDLGMIEVCVQLGEPRYTISELFFHQKTADQFAGELASIINDRNLKNVIYDQKEAVLGADIEAVLRHTNGKFVLASKFFTKKGRVGHDAIWLRGHRNSYPLVELRPAPSSCPRTLYKNVHRCIREGVRKINSPNIQWLAGGRPLKKYPIGGHIHFSKQALDPHFIRVLDNYLTLPLSLLESDESLLRRPKYGFLGDYREQYHGGFEYRTPPSWVISPTIAKGVLCLAKLLTIEYQQLNWLPLQSYETHRSFYQGKREELYPLVQGLWQKLRATESYFEYEKELENFYKLIEQRYVWNEYGDIRYAWRFSPYA